MDTTVLSRKAVVWAGLLLLAPSAPFSTQGAAQVQSTPYPRVTHAAALSEPAIPMRAAFTVGADDGVIFGDIRGVELSAEGTLVVLDHQASELLEFDLTGDAMGKRLTKGQGPREIGGANGVRRDGAGALWINDHGNGRLLRLGADGSVETHRRHVGGYMYLWNGGVTSEGRVWERWYEADRSGPPPDLGYRSSTSGTLYLGLDVATGAVDTVRVGPEPVRSVVLRGGVARVPFAPQRLSAIDPEGAIWTAVSSRYRLVRLSLTGDTLAVIEVSAAAAPITRAERDEAIADVLAFMDRAGGRVAVDWDVALPKTRPVLAHLSAGERGEVWVQREADGAVVFERFSAQGRLLGRYTASYMPHRGVPPVIRDGWLLAVQRDAYDVPSVVAFRIPGTE